MKTENQVIKFVQKNAKYHLHGINGFSYIVSVFQKIYLSNDTRELVVLICDDLEIPVSDSKKVLV